MRCVLLAVLFLSAAVMAQPLTGPFTVVENSAPNDVTNPHLVLRDNSTADLFYQMADTVYHATVSLANGAILAGPQALAPDSGFSRRLYDVIWTDSGWVAIVYDNNAPGNWNRTIVYCGQETVFASREIDSGRDYSESQWMGCSINSSLTLAARDSGQFAAAWSDYSEAWMSGGWFGEFWVDGGIFSFSGNQIHSIGPVFNQLDSLFLYNIGPDSLLSLSNHWGDLSICSLLSASSITPCDEYHSSFHPISFLPTRGGRYFILSQTDSAKIVELGHGTITERLAMSGSPLASTVSRDKGLSWLSKLGEELYLYRVDTLGTEHRPAGQLYVPAGTSQVIEAHMDLSATGKIAAVWTERATPTASTNIIKIASVGWDTALEAEHSFILPPSAFNLSAYPNPFNSETKIEYTLPANCEMDLSVYNVNGQRVETLRSGRVDAGAYSAVWTPRCGSGVYFVTLTSAQAQRTLKTIYLK